MHNLKIGMICAGLFLLCQAGKELGDVCKGGKGTCQPVGDCTGRSLEGKGVCSEGLECCDTRYGSILAEPITADIDSFLSNRAMETGRLYWIGGNDLNQEALFVWHSTQIPFSYTNWIPGDPNNADAGEDCVLTNWIGDGKWADGACEWTLHFICQKEAVSSETR